MTSHIHLASESLGSWTNCARHVWFCCGDITACSARLLAVISIQTDLCETCHEATVLHEEQHCMSSETIQSCCDFLSDGDACGWTVDPHSTPPGRNEVLLLI